MFFHLLLHNTITTEFSTLNSTVGTAVIPYTTTITYTPRWGPSVVIEWRSAVRIPVSVIWVSGQWWRERSAVINVGVRSVPVNGRWRRQVSVSVVGVIIRMGSCIRTLPWRISRPGSSNEFRKISEYINISVSQFNKFCKHI